MKTYGFHQLGVEAIDYDEQDVAERQKTQRVLDLATSRKAIAINPVTVASGKLVAGRDRLAADLLNGARHVWCHVVTECTSADLLRIEVEENVRRRDIDRDVQLARLVAVTEKEIKGKPPGKSGKAGRPVTPKGAARAEVAKVAGTTPEAVRRAETRAAAKAEPPKAPPPVRDFGVGIDPELAVEAVRVAGHLSTAAKALARAQAAFTEAEAALSELYGKDGHPHYTGVRPWLSDVSRLRDQTHALAGSVRGKVPVGLCPYGKGTCSKDCNACRGLKWATADQAEAAIPAELLREGADAMVSDGRGGFVKFTPKQAAPVSSRGPKAGKPPKDAARLEPAPAPSAAAGSDRFEDSRLRGNGAGQAGDKPAHAQVLTSANAIPGKARTRVDGQGAAAEPRSNEGSIPSSTARSKAAPPPPKSPKHRPINVELPGGRVVDALNPPDDLAYSGDDAPPVDLPELVVEPDAAVGGDDDSELWA